MKKKPKIGVHYKVFTKENGLFVQVINMRYHNIAIDNWEKNNCQPGIYTDRNIHNDRQTSYVELYFEPNTIFSDTLRIIGKNKYYEGITVQSETNGTTYYMEVETFIEIAKLGRINDGIMTGDFFMAKQSDKFRLVSTDLYDLVKR